MISGQLILLACLLALPSVRAAQLRTTARDMVEQQVPGVYQNLPLSTDSTDCPKQLRITQAEPMGDARQQMFAVPHAAISVPDYPSGMLRCTSAAVAAGSVTRVSATVLRRSGDLDLDRTDPVVDAFATAGESFFLGFEVGARMCNGWTLPAATVSMWMAPSAGRTVLARTKTNAISFRGGFKYIYYWSDPPCLYQGNAGEVGVLRKVPSPSPTPSRTPRPSNAVVVPGTNIGEPTRGDGGVGAGGGTGTGTGTGGGTLARPSARPGDGLTNGNGLTTVPVNGSDNERAVCFPGSAEVVTLRGGHPTSMPISSVKPGDSLHDGWAPNGTPTFSDVLGLSHADGAVRARFVHLQAGNFSLELSGSHYIATGRGLLPARLVRHGDILFTGPAGRHARVEVIARTTGQGLFAPVTASGSLVVDGVLASAYTETLPPPGAHAALAPARAFRSCGAAGVATVAGTARWTLARTGW